MKSRKISDVLHILGNVILICKRLIWNDLFGMRKGWNIFGLNILHLIFSGVYIQTEQPIWYRKLFAKSLLVVFLVLQMCFNPPWLFWCASWCQCWWIPGFCHESIIKLMKCVGNFLLLHSFILGWKRENMEIPVHWIEFFWETESTKAWFSSKELKQPQVHHGTAWWLGKDTRWRSRWPWPRLVVKHPINFPFDADWAGVYQLYHHLINYHVLFFLC